MAERVRPSSSSSRFPGLVIANVVFTDTQLGRGADATVYEVECNGTLCAAKRLHEILLEDQSAGGVAKLISKKKQLFLPIVCHCLENRPDKRPSSVMLAQELRRIKSSLPTGSHVAAPIEQLSQQLSAKEEECRQKDEMIREKEKALSEKETVLTANDVALREKDVLIRKI